MNVFVSMLHRQSHTVPVLCSGVAVFCLGINIDESWKHSATLLWRHPMFHLHFFVCVFFMKWNDKTASNWVIVVYDAVMMQQKHFPRWSTYLQKIESWRERDALPDAHCKPVKYIYLITSNHIWLIKVYCKADVNDEGSHGLVDNLYESGRDRVRTERERKILLSLFMSLIY